MADISDLAPIQQMTLLEQCPKEERRALHGLLLMRSSASYSAAPPSVEEMERAGEAKEVEETEEEKTARKAYIKRCMTALLMETEGEKVKGGKAYLKRRMQVLFGLMLMGVSSASYSTAPPSVEEMER